MKLQNHKNPRFLGPENSSGIFKDSKNFNSAQKSKRFLTCPKCNSKLKKVKVEIEDANSKAISYQCPNCDYFTFEPKSAIEVIREIKEKESPLKIKQRIIKLSEGRLGIYFNKDIIRSLNLKPGEEIFVSVPDRKRIVLRISD